MFGSPILDVALGLVFVYLIYSLFVTTLMELLASVFGLRARLLRGAVYRMLNDDPAAKPWNYSRLRGSLVSFVCFFIPPRWRWLRPDPSLAWTFYNMPSIKYLGLSSWFKRPSYISPDRFAKTLCDVLKSPPAGNTLTDEELVSMALRSGKVNPLKYDCVIEPETLQFFNSLWAEKPAEGQSREEKFRQQLVVWYNETMELLTGKYKKRMQMNTLALGLLIAVVFNVNSIEISTRLAKSDKARDALVALAGAWIENHGADTLPVVGDTGTVALKPLLGKTIRMLQNDVNEPNNLLALGYNVPDNFKLLEPQNAQNPRSSSDSLDSSNTESAVKISKMDSSLRIKALQKIYNKRCREYAASSRNTKPISFSQSASLPCRALPFESKLTTMDRLWFVWYCISTNYAIGGFLITAIAISLGAPFWFDLLNKIVKIKNEGKKPETSS
ncbi:MAG: hypothetical protein PHQ65_10990 [Bacteroidales bacterium]|nr:hypothetical protein [Bacteroidales bacterium]MDD3665780.1 hypothetical protein [Bacteroidales bacterium]